MLTSTIFLRSVSTRRCLGWLYLSQDWSCLSCDMRGSRFPPGCQWWIGKTRFLLKARLYCLKEEERAKGEDIAYKGGNTNEDIDNFTLDLEDMEASPSQPQQQPQLSVRDSHMHLLMLSIASTCFLVDSTISNVHRKLCNGCWMISVRTPTQMTFLQEQIITLSTHIGDSVSED